ncbi:MAG: NusG domain II-containing protein [Clostridia bacterium]|nr:NusG domain II-containing protein [Clostridia bacterium]
MLLFAHVPACAQEKTPPEAYEGSMLKRLGLPYAEAYVLVTAGGVSYVPIPLLGDREYTLRQGEGVENTIHVTDTGVYMAHATCENQDCVNQGEVTLQNRDFRILGSLIICLPNQVEVALYTFEEMEALLNDAFASSGAREAEE